MTSRTPRYCSCGTRLARDNTAERCSGCQTKAREMSGRAPRVPAAFWESGDIREALGQWHMGRVIAAYRHHPFHGHVLRQEAVAAWVGITQAQLSRIESGPPIKDLDKLIQWARVLGVPAHHLWFRLPEHPTNAANDAADESRIDDMNRRDLLRALSIAGTLAVSAPPDDGPDWERLQHHADRPGPLDVAAIDQYAQVNTRLWQDFANAKPKQQAWSAVRHHLDVLTEALRRSQPHEVRRRLCGLAADLFQLAGEILFDGSHYTDAAHCYTLAATASKEAGAYDLWACALTRHAFIGVYERQPRRAEPLLDLAAGIARRGDPGLSTRYWVQAVAAQTYAGLGDAAACRRALDLAEDVRELRGDIHNGGWLRFDASRLTEERGSCYTELGLTDLAEDALSRALTENLSLRRRGTVLTDLALVGVQRRDPDQFIMYANAALDTARQSGSDVIGSKLRQLQSRLTPYLDDRHVQHLSSQIDTIRFSQTSQS